MNGSVSLPESGQVLETNDKAKQSKSEHVAIASEEHASNTNEALSSARKSTSSNSPVISSSPFHANGANWDARPDHGSGRGRGNIMDSGRAARVGWNNGDLNGQRGRGRGAIPSSFSSFRSRNMATGANETPLGTPTRSFSSLTSSPVSTPRLTPTPNDMNYAATPAVTDATPIVPKGSNVDPTGEKKAKDESELKEKKEKKKKSMSEGDPDTIHGSSEVAEKTEPMKKKEKRNKKRKLETNGDAEAPSMSTADAVSLTMHLCIYFSSGCELTFRFLDNREKLRFNKK